MNSSPASEQSERSPPSLDSLLMALDGAMRTLFAEPVSSRPHPAENVAQPDTADAGMQATPPVLSAAEQREVGALMRVNHVGEVCAQALYAGQALGTRDATLRAHLQAAGKEETDHLAWTLGRLRELNDRPSLLNPLWYAGAFTIGFCASRWGGDARSLGFVVETERQVEAHLDGHLDRLPAQDWVSRAIVKQMKADEVEHAVAAEKAGALPLPTPMRGLMRAAAKVMTTVAHRI